MMFASVLDILEPKKTNVNKSGGGKKTNLKKNDNPGAENLSSQ